MIFQIKSILFFILNNQTVMTYLRISIFCFFLSTFSFAQNKSDSLKKAWQFHGFIQINNNGISPVPAFSLGRPALMSTFLINKGNFSFSPEFNYGLDGKPWVVNQWARYVIHTPKVHFRIGLNASLFFNSSGPELKTNQYGALETAVVYPISKQSSVQLIYWRSRGLDPTAIKNGNFISLAGSFTQIKLSKQTRLDFRPNIFYIQNQIPFKGLFASAITSIQHKKLPFNLFVQAVQPIKVVQQSKFSWNTGINFLF